MNDLAHTGTNGVETDANEPRRKFALVVTNMANPNVYQGFPLFAKSGEHAHEMVEQCVMDSMPVHIFDDDGSLAISVIIGAGQTYQIRDWASFAAETAAMRAQQEAQAKSQAEAATAARFGVAPTRSPRKG